MRCSYMLLLVIYNGSLIDSNPGLQHFYSFVVFEPFCKVITAMANCKVGRMRRNFLFESVNTFTLPGSDSCSALFQVPLEYT